MGGILFIIVLVASIYLMSSFFRARSSGIGLSRREPFLLNHPRATMQVEPKVTPVDEDSKKIPDRLPQVNIDYVPAIAPLPERSLTKEVIPNFTSNQSKIEESLLFRSLALAMFAISVIAVDLAAGTRFMWTAIPFASIGAGWSWYRRHHAKDVVNIVVSVASLAILFGVFVPILFKQIPPLPKLAATLGLMLGAMMIALQMGLSFHLYSRRILGYSFVTSAILIAVAASLIQNIGTHNLAFVWLQNIVFLLLFCKFVAIAIPTLMLDYRSRLALPPISIQSISSPGQLPYQHLPWKYLTRLAAMVIGLGMVLSIFAPNFHLPDLSFKPNNLDQIQALAQKYRPPNSNPPASTAPTSSNPPPIDQKALASKVFGQPSNNNYPAEIKQDHLQLPPEVAGQLQQFTQKILATSPQPLPSDFDRAAYLAEYIRNNFLDGQDMPPADIDAPLNAKLIQRRMSECPANANPPCPLANVQDNPALYTAMLRSIGIPARLKTGDKLAQLDPQTQLYPRPIEHQSSQTEIYSPNWGWVGLNSTPNDRPIVNLPTEQLAQLQAQAQQLAPTPSPSIAPTPPPNPNPATPPIDSSNQSPADLKNSIDNSSHNSPTNNSAPPPLPELPKDLDLTIIKVVIVILAIGGGIAWYLRHRTKEQQQLANLPPIERIYRSMIISLSKTGNAKVRSQTQLEYAHSIKNTEHPQIAKVVAEISQLYTAWRYGKEKIDVQHLAKKLQNLKHLQQLAADRQRQQWISNQKALWLGNTKKPPIK
jgi:Transglutaminase-like superfamily